MLRLTTFLAICLAAWAPAGAVSSGDASYSRFGPVGKSCRPNGGAAPRRPLDL